MTKLEQLEARGFDKSVQGPLWLRVGCSQCEALCINGVATHETGCPNQRRAVREDDE